MNTGAVRVSLSLASIAVAALAVAACTVRETSGDTITVQVEGSDEDVCSAAVSANLAENF